jgi:Na+/proline symporter
MINIAGIISIVIFYILILAVGLWAARKKQSGDDSEEEVMLAGRSIGLFVGIFTMTGESWPIGPLTKLPVSLLHCGDREYGSC